MTEIRGPQANRRVSRIRWLHTIVSASSAALFGCGNADSLPRLQVYEVKGRVLLADGNPLKSGWISFVPKGDLAITPSAKIAADGTFSLVTGGSGEGAPSGDYKVRIEAPEFRPDPKTRKTIFPFRYTDEDSSGIVVTVLPKENHLEPIRLR
jgi:hypothetical protein